jgi:hypothetical protein
MSARPVSVSSILAQVRRIFGHDDFQRGPDVAFAEMPGFGGAVAGCPGRSRRRPTAAAHGPGPGAGTPPEGPPRQARQRGPADRPCASADGRTETAPAPCAKATQGQPAHGPLPSDSPSRLKLLNGRSRARTLPPAGPVQPPSACRPACAPIVRVDEHPKCGCTQRAHLGTPG